MISDPYYSVLISVFLVLVLEYLASDILPGPNIDIVGDASNLPFLEESFDTIISTHSGKKSLFRNENFEIVECDSYGKLFTVLYGFIKFSFFNPYKKSKKGSWIINDSLFRVSRFLNKFTKNRIIYDSVYIIAKKK